jgi:hypothetical protein
LVYGDATVEAHSCDFSKILAGSAAVVYQNASLKLWDTKLIDLAGIGVLAYGNTELTLGRCGFGNISNSGAVVHSGASVTISETLFDKIGGCGLILRNGGHGEIQKSKFTGCVLSGAEVSGTRDVVVDHSVFEANSECGLVTIGSTIKVSDSDFTQNKLGGLDVRDCEFEISKCVVLRNSYGGMAVSNSRGVITGGGFASNQRYGMAISQSSTVEISDIKVFENDMAIYGFDGCDLTIEKSLITDHFGDAIIISGRCSKMTMKKCEVTENDIGLAVADQAGCIVEGCQFGFNSRHLELNEGSEVRVIECEFKQSRGGVGVFVDSNARGQFEGCHFLDEAKAGLVVSGSGEISGCEVVECGVCGLFVYEKGTCQVSKSQFVRNGACGIQIMSGEVSVTDCEIEGHSTFGIHVEQTARLKENGNKYTQNSMSDVNYEE